MYLCVGGVDYVFVCWRCRLCICVLEVSIMYLPLFMILIFNFGVVPMVGWFCFPFYCNQKLRYSTSLYVYHYFSLFHYCSIIRFCFGLIFFFLHWLVLFLVPISCSPEFVSVFTLSFSVFYLILTTFVYWGSCYSIFSFMCHALF